MKAEKCLNGKIARHESNNQVDTDDQNTSGASDHGGKQSKDWLDEMRGLYISEVIFSGLRVFRVPTE